MKRMMVFLVALFLLIGVMAVSLKVHADYTSDITINSDGSVSPSDAPLSTVDNITYSLTNDMTGSITVERDNIMVNGAGHDITGDGIVADVELHHVNNVTIGNMTIGTVGEGIWLYSSSNSVISGNNITGAVNSGILINQDSNNNTVSSNSITNSSVGMYLESSPNNTVSGNNIETYDNIGIRLHSSSNNIVSGNNVTNNYFGISCDDSNNVTIIGNTVANNGFVGIYLLASSNDTIYHNNLNNTNQFYSSGSPNVWDNGFEGNYWSDYNGTDNNQDGIGDTPYVIDANNTDHYPLMGTFHSFNVYDSWTRQYELETVISNSTIENVVLVFAINSFGPIPFYLHLSGVTGQEGTTGFCRITFPNIMMNSSSYPVWEENLEGNSSQISSRILMSNGTHTTLYFTYAHPVPDSTIDVFPEFPSFLILPLFFMTTLLAVILCRKRRTRCL